MEAIWTIPIYFVFPIIGVILIVIGIFKIRNGNSKRALFGGLGFLSIPFLHLALLSIFQLGLDNEIQGSYSIGNEKRILVLNSNGTFVLNRSSQYVNYGNGTWEIEEIDLPILKLNFEEKGKGELWLEIHNDEDPICLSSMPWENNISTEFKKE